MSKPQIIVTGNLLCTAPRRNGKVTQAMIPVDGSCGGGSSAAAIVAGAVMGAAIGASVGGSQ